MTLFPNACQCAKVPPELGNGSGARKVPFSWQRWKTEKQQRNNVTRKTVLKWLEKLIQILLEIYFVCVVLVLCTRSNSISNSSLVRKQAFSVCVSWADEILSHKLGIYKRTYFHILFLLGICPKSPTTSGKEGEISVSVCGINFLPLSYIAPSPSISNFQPYYFPYQINTWLKKYNSLVTPIPSNLKNHVLLYEDLE